MSDPLTSDSLRAADALSGAERDARVEQLLLQGLDYYFSGRYDTAIHVWTRVLFLDRGHARARAYIERARSAQAERQRESDELLHQGVAAFDRGDTGGAQELLTAAVSQGASPEVALSYLGRIDRLRPGWTATADTSDHRRERPTPPPPPMPAPVPRGSHRSWPLVAVGTLAVLLAAWGAWTWFQVDDLAAALQVRPTPPLALAAPPDESLPVPTLAEMALTRAREQFAAGHAFDALRTLAVVAPGDPLEVEAGRLRADIQRALLSTAATGTQGTTGVLPQTSRP
jgi:hypothetical protein